MPFRRESTHEQFIVMSYTWVILAGVGEGGTLLVTDVAQNSGGGWNYYHHIAMDDRSSCHSLGHSQVPGTESPVAELGMRRQEWMLRPRMDAESKNGCRDQEWMPRPRMDAESKNGCCRGFSEWSTTEHFNRKTPQHFSMLYSDNRCFDHLALRWK